MLIESRHAQHCAILPHTSRRVPCAGTIEYDAKAISPLQLVALVEELGFEAQVLSGDPPKSKGPKTTSKSKSSHSKSNQSAKSSPKAHNVTAKSQASKGPSNQSATMAVSSEEPKWATANFKIGGSSGSALPRSSLLSDAILSQAYLVVSCLLSVFVLLAMSTPHVALTTPIDRHELQ